MAISTDRPWLASYAEGVPTDIEPPTGSLYDLIRESVEQYPDHVALEFFGRTTTYAELGAEIDRVAEGLRVIGVQPGDPVAIVLPNCPQHIVAFYAVLRLGAIVVEHNPLYTPRELRHQFEDHEANVVIAWDKTVATIQEFPKDVRPEHIVSVNMIDAMPGGLRFALGLPTSSVKKRRDALHASVTGTTPWKKFVGGEQLKGLVPAPTV